jgi:hypothetical protein
MKAIPGSILKRQIQSRSVIPHVTMKVASLKWTLYMYWKLGVIKVSINECEGMKRAHVKDKNYVIQMKIPW